MVWINKHFDLPPNIPYGGAKQSGIGVEFDVEGLAEYTQLKSINVALQRALRGGCPEAEAPPAQGCAPLIAMLGGMKLDQQFSSLPGRLLLGPANAASTSENSPMRFPKADVLWKRALGCTHHLRFGLGNPGRHVSRLIPMQADPLD